MILHYPVFAVCPVVQVRVTHCTERRSLNFTPGLEQDAWLLWALFPPTPVLLLALAALRSHPCTSGHVLQIPVHCFALGYCLLKSTANSNCKEELHKGPWEKWEGGEEQGKIRKLYFNFLNNQMPTFPITWNVTHLCNTLCPSWTTVVGLPSPTQRCKASSTVLGGGGCQPKWRMQL